MWIQWKHLERFPAFNFHFRCQLAENWAPGPAAEGLDARAMPFGRAADSCTTKSSQTLQGVERCDRYRAYRLSKWERKGVNWYELVYLWGNLSVEFHLNVKVSVSKTFMWFRDSENGVEWCCDMLWLIHQLLPWTTLWYCGPLSFSIAHYCRSSWNACNQHAVH